MAKPTPNEVRERKEEIIKLGKDIATLTESEGWKYLSSKLDELINSSKEEVLKANSWDDFLTKKAYHEGVGALKREVAKTISRSQHQQSSLTT